MTGRVLVLRPEPGASATADLARGMGLVPVLAPMAQVMPEPWSAPDPDGFDAVLLGSANAVRHAGPQLPGLRALPALVVGEATARAAREAGFTVAQVGEGGLQSVLDRLAEAPGPRRLLRLAGAQHVALAAPPGVSIAVRVVYRVAYLPLSGQAVRALAEGAVVLLHSGEAAGHFSAECDRLSLRRGSVGVAALAPRIAEAAGHGWRALEVASAPTDAALLELARDMCQ